MGTRKKPRNSFEAALDAAQAEDAAAVAAAVAAAHIEYMRSRFDARLADKETWIGVYENQAFDSVKAGQRVAMFFDLDQWDRANIGDRAPDTSALAGWKYRLVGKAKTTEEALNLMAEQ